MSKETAEELAARLNDLRESLEADKDLYIKFEEDPDAVLEEKGFSPILRERFRAFASDEGCGCTCLPLFDGTGVGCFGTFDGAKGFTA